MLSKHCCTLSATFFIDQCARFSLLFCCEAGPSSRSAPVSAFVAVGSGRIEDGARAEMQLHVRAAAR